MEIRKMELNQRSKNNLAGVNKVLVEIMEESIKSFDENFYFIITEGVRTKERQQQLFNEKKSRTLDSYHLTGHAVDIAMFVNKKLSWDLQHYVEATKRIKEVADRLGYKIEFGVNWKWTDSPHIQIDRKLYL